MQGQLFIISGCSGVGKGTLVKMFTEKNPSVKLSISTTTRLPRPNEKEGVDYFFVTKEQFQKSVKNDEFLEWACFSGNYYGTKKEFVEKTISNGDDLILEIDVQGANQIKKKIPGSKTVFIMPPSLAVLEQRLRGRKTETEDAILKRLSEVEREIETGKHFDYTIVNDELETALESLKKIFNGSKNAQG